MQKIDEKIMYQGRMIEIVEESIETDGKIKLHESGRRAPGVRLIIMTPDGEFLISKEMRPSIGMDYRLPGGKVFDSLVEYNEFLATNPTDEIILEKAKEAAIKEGEEEMGIKATDVEFFCKSRCGGSFEWDLYYFIVKKYEETKQRLEDAEKIEVVKVNKEKLKELAFSGQMNEDRSVGILAKYFYKK
jgi:ADP-ribose pyrophosphatase YjhB (NUDIX family)